MNEPLLSPFGELAWYVAHTRPRAEKKLADLYAKWERLSSEIEKVESGLE